MLAQRDPFRELMDLNNTFNRFFDHVWSDGWFAGQQWVGGAFPLDLTETEEGYQVKASLPGLAPDDLEITLSNNVLTIKGEIKPDREEDTSRYHLKERWSGVFQRSLTLPTTVVVDNIQANYEAGVLTLFIPKSEEARPKRISIQSGAQPKMIEGQIAEKS